MSTVNPFPFRMMQAFATGQFTDHAEIWGNDGYGWKLVGLSRCQIHHRLTPAVPADPMDSTAANVEYVEGHFPLAIPIRIGMRVKARGNQWTVGGGNFSESYRTFNRAMMARPIAASPLTWITLLRWNRTLEDWQELPPQLVHVAWSRNQPDRLGGISIRQFGWIFPPENGADLDIMQGDSFNLQGLNAVVQWVPPEPTDRREAIFQVNIGEGT